MEDREDIYFDFTKDEKDYAVRFLLESLLKARIHLAGERRPVEADDVNIYLAHLLFAVSTTTYQKLAQKYVSHYASDVAQLIDQSDDNYIKYFTYKINADHLLVHLGVFQGSIDNMVKKQRILSGSPKQYWELAGQYYAHAARYNQRIYRKKTAVGDVLEKLSSNFEEHCNLLQATRRDYFHFINHFKDNQFSEFLMSLKTFEKDNVHRMKMDEFLDLYLEWKQSPSDSKLRVRMEELCGQLKCLDPNFEFCFDEQREEAS